MKASEIIDNLMEDDGFPIGNRYPGVKNREKQRKARFPKECKEERTKSGKPKNRHNWSED